jgi:hypothetical protein
MYELIKNENKRDDLIKKGVKRLEEFKWENAAKIVISEFRKLGNEK